MAGKNAMTPAIHGRDKVVGSEEGIEAMRASVPIDSVDVAMAILPVGPVR